MRDGTPAGGGWRGSGAAVAAEGAMPVGAISLRTFASLKSPAFRLYWFAMLAQFGAMNMQMVARSWLMYDLTGSTALLGTMALAQAAPMMLLSLYGGLMADRLRKKYILVAGMVASFVLALVIGLAITAEVITWHFLIAYSLVAGTVFALMMPARQAIIPELVGPQGLTNAVALNAAGMNMERLLAPVTAGFLIAFLGIAGVYYIMAAFYLVSMLILSALPITGTLSVRGRGTGWADMKDGLRYVRGNPAALIILLVTLLIVLFSMPYMTLLLPIIKEGLHVTDMDEAAKKLGILLTVSGAGALVGSLIVASLPDRKRGLVMLVSALLLAVTLVVLSFSSWYWLSLVIMVPLGLGQAGRMALSNALLQANISDEYRGRVMSIYMMEFGLTSVGTFFVALIAEVTGVQVAVGGAALMLIAVVLYYMAFSPHFRKLD